MPQTSATDDVQGHGPVLTPSPGPTNPMASMPRAGLKHGTVHHFRQQVAGGSTRIGGGFRVRPGTVFELAVFPDLEHDPTRNDSPDPNFDGCSLGVEFITETGSVTLRDQHEHVIDGSRQCLVADNWNLLQLSLDELVGQRVEQVLLASRAGLVGSGWLQVFGMRPRPVEEPDVVDRVRTTRGTHSAFLYSRGNALPLTCVPQGFNFLVPLTESRDRNWLYGWHRDGGPVPKLSALAFCHQPSPWIADRSAFQIMPWQGHMTASPTKRARAFSHDDEIDRPHYYRVDLDGGIRAEMTPTSRAGVFKFTFTESARHGVVLDQPFVGTMHTETLDDGRVAFHASIAPAEGWTVGLHRPSPPAYVYGETNAPATVHRARERRSPLEGIVVINGKRLHKSWFGKLTVPLPRPQAAILETEADVLEVRAAMSFLGVEQARRNLEMEVGQASFDDIAGRAHATWTELLGRLEIDGGTLDQRITAWSNLACLYSWPNDHHENVGSPEEPRWAYASPFRPAGAHTPDHTGCQVVDGQLSVNNGYWDTFRTCWPLYSLLTPEKAPELLGGILQQYRDGGWMARWSAPGYVDCMPGTSSDAIFADASLAHTFASGSDELAAYDSALRNATGPSDSVLTGRKGIGKGRFVGWIDTDTEEGLAWTMDNASCDAAISLWSGRLAVRATNDPRLASRREELEANEVWFANRALAHAEMFDAGIGFYQGRRPDGGWRVEPKDFDPRHWGHDYTETNAWGQAFHAPHDGALLAKLLGGEHALADKLDEMLRTPAVTSPAMWGSYTYNTQEMNEAQADGIGQLAISNQPAHHIPFMYLFAGQPHKTQWLTRELLDKKFVGSEIGQGYPGDEDNGEMSGYWLLLAMGLYPVFVGGGELAITAPLFAKMAWNRTDGTRLEIRATGIEHRYIQSLRVNGELWNAVTIPAELVRGNALLEFELGPEPSSWGAGTRPWSASTATGQARRWQPDRTPAASYDGPECLVDDRGENHADLSAGDVVSFTWEQPFTPLYLTVTSPEAAAPGLRVEVRCDGEWADAAVVTRSTPHPDQTAAYRVGSEPIDELRLVATAPCRLSQVEVY
ncbi:MAG: GH92 family glycosyl hydrolase [Luteococcus sp.]|uniref:GH92 family glycosyl hydrolase n=1 Tax=Luteococcus sp. TaxID=1969402 RepID=UPI002649C42E|nr:GH92 family glycosyl hydrolase [Luteococcus sp.]MDN5563288.1 GH92 family glycosyl hydrolase [Luteococcus sp.]